MEEDSTRDKILQAAEKLFAEKGFSTTSISDIALQAKVNRALIFYYFKSKKELCLHVVEQTHRESLSRIKKEVSCLTEPLGKLKKWVELVVPLMFAKRDVWRTIVREVLGLGEGLNLPLKKFIEEWLDFLKEIILEGIEKGTFKEFDPTMTAISLFGMIESLLKQPYITGLSYPLDSIIRHTTKVFLDGVKAR